MTCQASVTLHMLYLLPGKTTLILSIWGISTHLPCPSPRAVSSAKPSLTHPSRDDVAWPWALQSFSDFGSCYTHLLVLSSCVAHGPTLFIFLQTHLYQASETFFRWVSLNSLKLDVSRGWSRGVGRMVQALSKVKRGMGGQGWGRQWGEQLL